MAVAAVLVLGACGGGSRAAPAASAGSTASTAPAASTDTTTARSTTTTAARPARPAPVPAATEALVVEGRRIVAVDGYGRRLGTLVTVYAGQVVEEAQLAADRESIWYVERGAGGTCGKLVHLDLVTDVRRVVTPADSFALSPDGARLATARWVDGAGVCYGSHGEPYRMQVEVRDLRTGRGSTWYSAPRGESPASIFLRPARTVWAPDATRLAVLACETGCTTRVLDVPARLGGGLHEAPFSPRRLQAGPGPTEEQDVAWTAAGLVVIDDSGLCCLEYEDGATLAIDRYDTRSLALASTIVESRDDYVFEHLAPVGSGDFLVVADRFVRGADSKLQFTGRRRFYRLDARGTLAPCGAPPYGGPVFPAG